MMLTCIMFLPCGYTTETVSILMFTVLPHSCKCLTVTQRFACFKENAENIKMSFCGSHHYVTSPFN